MAEIWRAVPSCPGYQASNLGRIKSPFGRVLSQENINGKGHRRVATARGGKRKKLVARLVCEAFIRPPSSADRLGHINGAKGDNRPDNLQFAAPRVSKPDPPKRPRLTDDERNQRKVEHNRKRLKALLARKRALQKPTWVWI